MAKILSKTLISPSVYELVVEAPLIARKCQPGQFVILLSDPDSERVPFTIADFDREAGTLTMIIQVVGNTSRHICEDFDAGDDLTNVVGPLGQPSEMKNFGTVVCVGGGIGVAPVYPIARAYKELGNKVISIIGGRNKDLVLWEDKMRAVSDELIVCTDDGSYGRKGFVTDPLKEMLEKGGEGRLCYRHRPRDHDEECSAHHRAFRRLYCGQPEHDYGRRNRHVRRLPCPGGRRKQICLCGWSGIQCSQSGFCQSDGPAEYV